MGCGLLPESPSTGERPVDARQPHRVLRLGLQPQDRRSCHSVGVRDLTPGLPFFMNSYNPFPKPLLPSPNTDQLLGHRDGPQRQTSDKAKC